MATGKTSGKPAEQTPPGTRPGKPGSGTDSSIIKPARTPPSTSGGGKPARSTRPSG